jgi:hypothetical protein
VTAYRDRDTNKLVDAEVAPTVKEAPNGIRVLTGPNHSSETRTRPGEWVVLDPGRGYEVWSHIGFGSQYEKADTTANRRKLDEMLRTCRSERVRELA